MDLVVQTLALHPELQRHEILMILDSFSDFAKVQLIELFLRRDL